MIFREASIKDIAQIQFVRNAVKENVLSDPALVPDSDVEEYMTKRGKGWVCEVAGNVVGFSIVDLVQNNVWALFIHPDFEAKGIGKKLHQLMMDCIFYKPMKRSGWEPIQTAGPMNFTKCRAGKKLANTVK